MDITELDITELWEEDFDGKIELSLENLIENGYLPYEIVPAINTKQFAEKIKLVENRIKSFNKPKYSKYCSYTIPKVKHVRRTLAIPNPYHQLKLSQYLIEKWEDIKSYIKSSSISLSMPQINQTTGYKERTFKRKINLGGISKQSILHSTDSRYLLKADISRFYPTIYTHTIPWALHSKKVAKEKQRDNKLLGNRLDYLIRATQENQTIGIPIGPDTSLVISEIIGTAIDKELENKLYEKGISLKGFRFVDDFYLFFKKFNEAQYALSILHQIMKEFELELSPEKTKIIELPYITEPKWTLELRKTQVFNKVKVYDDEIITFFNRAFELSKEFPDDSVLKYALSEIADMKVEEEQWEVYESLLLNSMVVEPSVLPIATEILIGYKNAEYKLNNKKIRETLFEIILYHCSYGHTHEVSWALWLCKSLNYYITQKIVRELVKIDDSVIALITLDLYNMNKIKKLDLSFWESLITESNLYTDYWLLVYEGVSRKWIGTEDDLEFLKNDDFFGFLLENNISFYESEAQVMPIEIDIPFGKLLKKRMNRRKKRLY